MTAAPLAAPRWACPHLERRCHCRYKLSELARISEVIDVCAACVDGTEDTFVEVLVSLVKLCAKVTARAVQPCPP